MTNHINNFRDTAQGKECRAKAPRFLAKCKTLAFSAVSFSGLFLVGHRVDDIVDAYADAEVGEAEGVAGPVEPLPGVADVGVLGDRDHDVALVVVDASPAGDAAVLFVAGAEVFGAGDLVAIREIEDGVEDGVVVGDVDDGTVGEDHLHGLFEVGLLFGSVEVVGHKEAAAEEIVA